MGVWYCTREDVKSALDSAETARNNAQVDRAIEAASRSVERAMHRTFYPYTGTRYFDWPTLGSPTAWRLWLDQHDLVSVTTLNAGGTVIGSSNYFLEPVNTGPPYTHVEINLASSSAFAAGSTFQRAIAITGVWAYSADEATAGTLAAAVSSTSATSINVSDSSTVGVGQLIRVDSERMTVTGKNLLTTGQSIQQNLTASAANDQVALATGIGATFTVGETITVDSERMLIVDIAADTLVVKRAWDGSTLAAHASSTIYAPRTLTVTRAAVGTTAATHLNAAAVSKWTPPGLIRTLTIAESLLTLTAETAGYTRTNIRGEGAGRPMATTVDDLRDQAYTAHGRKLRTRAV
jgi:hypothetical protein